MPSVEETTVSRFGWRARHGLRVLTTPHLWGEQIEFLRHGPSTSPDATALAVTFPASPWRPPPPGSGPYCNICGGAPDAFLGARHVEGQLCTRCGSNARDRFSFFCFTSRTPPAR